MNEEAVKGYVRRVTQANRSELIVIIYDIILEDIKDAREALQKDAYTPFRESVTHAVRFVGELMVCLNTSYPISKNLMQLYLYVNRCLNHAKSARREEELGQAEAVLGRLREAFVTVAEQDASSPLMENTQKLFAGLTYGRGVLNETLVSDNEEKRGFRA